MTVLAGRWLISLPAVSIPERAPPLSVLGVINEGSPLSHPRSGAPARCAAPPCCRRYTSGATLHRAGGGDALQGVAPQYGPCHSPWRSAGDRRHRFLLDPGYRRL